MENERNNNIEHFFIRSVIVTDTNIVDVNIDFMNYAHKDKNPLHNTNEKWFINLTNTDIPSTVINLLQMGGNFCLSSDTNKMGMVHEFIKDLETFNRHTININRIKKHNTLSFHVSINSYLIKTIIIQQKKIARLYKGTQFFKKNSNIIFTRADKRNVTVASNKDDYINR